MRADLKRAKELFSSGEYTCVLCKGEEVITSTERGVKPLIEWLESKSEFDGFCVADKVVGKAAASLYVLLGVSAVYASVMSKSAIDTLSNHGVEPSCDLSVEAIRNWAGNDICPMEKAVQDIDDPKMALDAIKLKIKCHQGEEVKSK